MNAYLSRNLSTTTAKFRSPVLSNAPLNATQHHWASSSRLLLLSLSNLFEVTRPVIHWLSFAVGVALAHVSASLSFDSPFDKRRGSSSRKAFLPRRHRCHVGVTFQAAKDHTSIPERYGDSHVTAVKRKGTREDASESPSIRSIGCVTPSLHLGRTQFHRTIPQKQVGRKSYEWPVGTQTISRLDR